MAIISLIFLHPSCPQIAFMAMPYREVLLESLGTDEKNRDVVLKDISDYQKLLSSHVDSIKDFYQSHSLSAI